jgi:mannose-6-phosphate isomerase-like protein (cupin superfamily)
MPEEAPKSFCITRPWGNFVQFTQNRPSTVKIITVSQGESLSLQKHNSRDEFWHVISGEGQMTIGTEIFPATVGQDYFIPRNTLHRIQSTTSPLVILEIGLGNFDENDISRIDDKYGRTSAVSNQT